MDQSFNALPSKGDWYPMQFMAETHNPADATTYWFGFSHLAPQTTGASPHKLYFPGSGSIRWLAFMAQTLGTLGSAETGSVYIRIDGTTDYLVSSALTWNAGQTGFGGYFDSGVIPVVQDHFMEFIVVTPTWVTNPTQVYYRAQIRVDADE